MNRFSACLGALLLAGVPAAAGRGAPEVVEVWPAKDAACPDTPLRLTFNGSVALGKQGRIIVYRARDQTAADTIDLGAADFTNEFGGLRLHDEPILIEGKQATVQLHAHSLQEGESYFVRIDPGVFKDADGNECAGITDASRWRFTVKPAVKEAGRLVVAADGSGDFCTVQGAVDQVPPNSPSVTEIVVREGVYEGITHVPVGKDRIHLAGQDRRRTILSGRNNEKLNSGRRRRALLSVDANDFVLENLTVHNSTPSKGSQAEAVRVDGDRCVLRHADFFSYQDTLQLSGRIYVADCLVEGDVDFLWGYGSAFLEDCELRAVHSGYYVQARNPAGKPGYLFSNCKLTAAPGVERCWLARIEADRFPGSQVAFLHCRLGPQVPPAGWQVTGTEVGGLHFEEFESTDLEGKLLDVSRRDRVSRQLSSEEAAALADPARVLGGHDDWKPQTRAAGPEGKVFDVRRFGAQGDGKTLDTAAIQKALDEAGQAGGGVVRVPAGTYLSKPIFLHSHTTLQLDAGATLRGTEEPADYGLEEGSGRGVALVNGTDLKDVALTGQGVVDGAGLRWWQAFRRARQAGQPEPRRPHLVRLNRCAGVRVEGITLTNSPMFHLVPAECEDVVIKGVTITAPADSPNTDGIDPSACHRVQISDCRIDVGDDNVALKSARVAPAHPGAACSDILVTDCLFLHGHGMSIGSETVGGVRNLFVQDCTFEGTRNGLRIKSPRGRGGLVENVRYSDITMKDVDPAITITCYYPKVPAEDAAQPVTPTTPLFRNIQIVNLSATCTRDAGMIIGLPESPVTGVVLDNVHITARSGLTFRNTAGVQRNGVRIDIQPGSRAPGKEGD